MKKYGVYLTYCARHKGAVLVGVAMMAANAILSVRLPFMLNDVLNNLITISHQSFPEFITKLVLYSLLFMLQLGIGLASSILFKFIGNEISQEICTELYKKVFRAVKTDPPQVNIGNSIVVFDRDCFALGEHGILLVYKALNLAINILGILIYMIVTSIILAILIIIVFLIIMLIQTRINAKIEKTIDTGRSVSSKYTYNIQSLANNHDEYRCAGAFQYVFTHFKGTLSDLLFNRMKLTRLSVASESVSSVGSVANMVLVFTIGAVYMLWGGMPVSNLITFNMYSSTFGGYLTSIPSLFMGYKSLKISYQRVADFFQITTYPTGEEDSLSFVDSYGVRDLIFKYRIDQNLLNQLNIEFLRGNIYCISGDNGSGKSTIMSLLIGDYIPDGGSVILNGQPFNAYENKETVDEIISFQSSNPVVFNDSLTNNISLHRDIPPERVASILKVVNANEWISELPNGLDYMIEDTSQNLSNGQRQKIALARTLATPKPILLFDEIEKHLDQKTKNDLMLYLNSIKTDHIIVIVSHDPTIQEQCDVQIAIGKEEIDEKPKVS